MRSFGRNKTSSVHPGGIRMSIHEAPVFIESAPFDNVRMVSFDCNRDVLIQQEI